ncbi:ABC transporter ATP-binding protein [Enterococcus saccharolyticus]|uniref:ABC transporter n=1 Tax=Candidatus Enterococcus willemsii TaxID=1857215 RepID=A0ABQ6YWH8_9ENTE|nr:MULTISPECIES: ABC transporter ATP-binding protein [Enterococcus]KAF1302059.1 ABC transporter [Enterococcus sp. CU12B]MCD5002832.1 ABC transporter ATP-binding protein [Enterococcus saccharolyticus]
MLTINNFSKTYQGGKKAVDNLSLQVDAGDIFGFIGHNGAGKSTTIKALVGVLDYEEGEILINHHSMKKEPVICKQQLAYIPDNPDLYEHLTGIQYLNFIADIFNVSGPLREERIKKYAEQFEITGNLGDLISSYSHGMKQKLAIISAVLHEPKLLVLDEPFVGLDPKASIVLRELMHELCQTGSAIFFSTHVLEVAQKLCNKVAMIHQGKLAFSGSMDQLLTEHAGESLEDIFMQTLQSH